MVKARVALLLFHAKCIPISSDIVSDHVRLRSKSVSFILRSNDLDTLVIALSQIQMSLMNHAYNILPRKVIKAPMKVISRMVI